MTVRRQGFFLQGQTGLVEGAVVEPDDVRGSLIALPGWGHDSAGPGALWDRLAEVLALRGIRTVLVDYAGAGGSTRVGRQHRLTTLDWTSQELAARLAPDPILLVGHCYGMLTATRVAMAIPVDGVAFVGPRLAQVEMTPGVTGDRYRWLAYHPRVAQVLFEGRAFVSSPRRVLAQLRYGRGSQLSVGQAVAMADPLVVLRQAVSVAPCSVLFGPDDPEEQLLLDALPALRRSGPIEVLPTASGDVREVRTAEDQAALIESLHAWAVSMVGQPR